MHNQSDHPKNVPKPNSDKEAKEIPIPTTTPTEKLSKETISKRDSSSNKVGGKDGKNKGKASDGKKESVETQAQPLPEIEDLGSKTFKTPGSK